MAGKMFPFTEDWLVSLTDTAEKYAECARELPANENDWREGQIMRESLMSELDGLDMSEAEIEQVVEIQLPNNPHRLMFNTLKEKLYRGIA